MQLALKFWLRLVIWAGALLVFLVLVTLLFGQPFREVIAHLPVWASLALALAAFPAGISVSGETFPDGRLVPRRIVEAFAAAATVSLVMLTLGNAIAPAATRLGGAEGAATVNEAARMSWGELRREAKQAVAEAREATGADSVTRWLKANQLVWNYIRRTDGTALPLLFGILGVLTGFWSRLTPRREVQQLQQWGVGLFLLMSTYLVGENSYELIVLQATGPVFWAADLVLVIPGLLLLGIGWPTLIALWRRETNSGDPWAG